MVSGSRSRIRISVLMVVVVALRLATVSYDEGVSKRIIHFSCYCHNSPKQVLPAPLPSSSSVVVIVDDGVYGKSPCLLFLPSIVLIVVIATLRLPAASSDEESDYTTH